MELNNLTTKELLKEVSSLIYIENEMHFMKMFKGSKGYTFFYENRDKSKRTVNISDYDIDVAARKTINFLLERGYHHSQNTDRNILIDALNDLAHNTDK